eukprot:scaffold600587_cov15-Prasinocladus_malaysianus.AAC.1
MDINACYSSRIGASQLSRFKRRPSIPEAVGSTSVSKVADTLIALYHRRVAPSEYIPCWPPYTKLHAYPWLQLCDTRLS